MDLTTPTSESPGRQRIFPSIDIDLAIDPLTREEVGQ